MRAGKIHINTHIPCNINVIKNHEKECLIFLNLTSSPDFLTLKNKNELNLVAHIITIEPRSKEIKSMP